MNDKESRVALPVLSTSSLSPANQPAAENIAPAWDGQPPSVALASNSTSLCATFACGSVGQYIVESQQYLSVLQSSSCIMNGEQGICLLSGESVALDVYGSIKSGTCKPVSLMQNCCGLPSLRFGRNSV